MSQENLQIIANVKKYSYTYLLVLFNFLKQYSAFLTVENIMEQIAQRKYSYIPLYFYENTG